MLRLPPSMGPVWRSWHCARRTQRQPYPSQPALPRSCWPIPPPSTWVSWSPLPNAALSPEHQGHWMGGQRGKWEGEFSTEEDPRIMKMSADGRYLTGICWTCELRNKWKGDSKTKKPGWYLKCLDNDRLSTGNNRHVTQVRSYFQVNS